MRRKKTSIVDLWIYIVAIGAGMAFMGIALWILIIGAAVFVLWLILRSIFRKDE